jgi:hypothetical protein
VQLTAAALEFGETTPAKAANGVFAADSADTTRFQGQYVAAAGFTRGPFRLSGTARVRTFRGTLYSGGSARASVDQRFVGLSLFAERNAFDSTSRADAMVRIQPFSFIAFTGAAAVARPDAETGRPQSLSLRGEAGVRLGGLWLGGGAIVRDSAVLAAPRSLDPQYAAVLVGRSTGAFGRARGRVIGALYADAYAIRWEKSAYYLPLEEARAELYLSSRWMRRFPSGNFGIRLGSTFDYRSAGFFPAVTTEGSADITQETVLSSKVLSALLEIRIVNATLSYQLRNALGYQYSLVPGYEIPRTVNFYGVRWEFSN